MSALPRSRPPGRRARLLAGSVAAGAVVLTTALASTSLASAQSSVLTAGAGAQPSTPESSTGSAEARGHYDARYGKSSTAKAIAARGASKAASRGATKTFAKSLPAKAVFDIDGTTGTVRMLTRLDGYLTGKSNKKPTTIALKYVKANHDALGLTSGDLKTFKLKRDYVDIGGVHHLFWVQRIGGQTVFGNGLTAAVTKDGKLLTVGGSPVSKATLGAPAAARDRLPGRRHRRRPRPAGRRLRLTGRQHRQRRAGAVRDPARQPHRVDDHGHVGVRTGDPGRRRRLGPTPLPQPVEQ